MPDAARVVLIGGAPGTGKSPIARALGSMLGYAVISTDDLGRAARSLASRDRVPDLFAMEASNYQQYYLDHPVPELLEHALRAHRALWPAIREVIEARASWSSPAVIEGWALLPEGVVDLEALDVRAAWIGAQPSAVRSGVISNPAFFRGAANEPLMIERFSGRSAAFSDWLQRETAQLGLPFIHLDDEWSVDAVATQIINQLGRNFS